MKIKLPSIICSGMVIEKYARIWGFCDGSDSVEISFRDEKYIAEVTDGKWEAFVSSKDYGGPFEMKIGDTVLTDIYVGYVFMLSGQSNMETPAGRVRTWYEDDFIGLAANNRIRAFLVEKDFDFNSPRLDCKGYWRALSPETVDNFYAVSFYLSKILESTFDAPIGLIECAVGGSRIEGWMNESEARFHGYTAALLRICQRDGFVARITDEDEERAKKWYDEALSNDIGSRDNFQSSTYDCKDWPHRPLTMSWDKDIGLVNGVVWFRKTFEAPEDMDGLPGRLFMGTIINSDTAYLNGTEIGSTEYQYPPRVYDIPKGLIKKGPNTLAVRVVCERGYGGFTIDKDYVLETSAGKISVDGDWAYKIGYKASELPPATFFFNYPSGLYNAMLAPVMPFSISAFLWYQGESNGEQPHDYDLLLSKFVKRMRVNYSPSLPFLVVQLPNYDAGELNDNWQIMREKQATILNHPNTALIITTDIGEDNDIHPINKKDLSKRLAEGVLNLLRGDEIKSDKVLVSKN
jgi:sialate O-acetylesterase